MTSCSASPAATEPPLPPLVEAPLLDPPLERAGVAPDAVDDRGVQTDLRDHDVEQRVDLGRHRCPEPILELGPHEELVAKPGGRYAALSGVAPYASRLVHALTEAYPELKTNQNILALQEDIAGLIAALATRARPRDGGLYALLIGTFLYGAGYLQWVAAAPAITPPG